MNQPLSNSLRRCRASAHIAGIIGFVTGVTVLLGWLLHIPTLMSILPGAVTMKPNTALCFMLAGTALVFLRENAGFPRVARVCAGVVVFVGTLTLCQHWFGWDLGIDQVVIHDNLTRPNAFPGRMAPASALGFVLLGLSQILIDVDIWRSRRPAQLLALLAMLVGLLGLIGYIYGAPALHRLASYTSVAVHTASLFVILGLGTIFARPDRGLMGVITSKHGGGLMARRILPLAVTLPFVLGWLRMAAQHAGWFGTEFGLALFATSSIVTFATLVWFSARTLNAFDRKRHAAEESLRRTHADLEQRVLQRTSELAEVNTRLQEQILERAKAEHANQQILDYSLDVICTFDLEGRFLQVSRACEVLWGYKPEQLIGQPYIDMIYPDDREKSITAARSIMNGEPEIDFENRYLRSDGAVIPVVWTATWSAAEQIMFCVARDMTVRKQAESELLRAKEAAEAATKAKGDFLANMSHEIRTPMNGVIGMTNLLLDSELSGDQRRQAEAISKSGELLLSVINDILDFSKIEAGKLSFETLDFDLPEAVEGCLELFAQSAQIKGLELACLVESNVPAKLRGDPGRLRQVLVNFIGNAIKFTERGEVVVNVSLESESDTDASLRFEVRDTGIGIPSEAQARLFQPFSQADGSTTRKYGGTGLGLAISKQLIERMHGRPGVESIPGRGSVFWFTVRLSKQPEQAHASFGVGDELVDLRVLIVDDNETNRQILQHQTRAWKMSSGTAMDAAGALAELRRALAAGDPYEVVLLDMEMPGTDGLTLARNIKGESGLASVRLVLLSSLGTRINAEELKAAGIEDCLIKPVKQSLLFDSIATLIGKKAVGPNRAVEKVSLASIIPAQANQKLRVLLAEDNAVNQQVALGLLRKLGYQADTVTDGTEALEALSHVRYDVILMDCQMPHLDGYETTRRIRKFEQEGVLPFDRKAPIHIIALTANAMEGDRDKCLAAGMTDYLSKPVRRNELKAALDRYREIQPNEVADSPAKKSRPVPTLSEEVLVEVDRLRDVTDDDPDRMQQLIDIYLIQTAAMLENLDEAIHSNSSSDVARIAHKLFGSSAACGVEAFTRPLREMERLGREGNLSGAQVSLDDLREKFPRVQRAFAQFVETLPTASPIR